MEVAPQDSCYTPSVANISCEESLLEDGLAESNSIATIMDLSSNSQNIEVRCSICKDYFKEPKRLPCFHRICKGCLTKEVPVLHGKNYFKCPTCSHTCSIPDKGLDGFKTDYHMENIVEFQKIKSLFNEKAINDCFDYSEKSIHMAGYCFKCKNFPCDMCYKRHLTNKSVRDHKEKVISAKYCASDGFDLQKYYFLKEPQKCDVHDELTVDLCCSTCNNLPVCIKCAAVGHATHTIYDMKSLAAKEKPRSTNPHTQDARRKKPEKVIYQSKYNRSYDRATSALRVSDLGASKSGYSSTQPGTTRTVTSEAKVSRFLPPKQQVLQDSDIPIANRDIGTTYIKSEDIKQQGNRENSMDGGKSLQAIKRPFPTSSNRSARNTDVKKNKKEDATSAISNMPAQRLSGEIVNLSHPEVRKQQGNREITLIGGKSLQAPKRTYSTASNCSPLSSSSARNTDVKKNQKEDATSAIPKMPAQRPSGEPVNLSPNEQIIIPTFDIDGN